MKFLLNFKELFESTSAFSQERAGWEYPPFKFAKNFDPRIGYSKDDLCKDLSQIYKDLNPKKRRELMDIISQKTGLSRINDIKNLQNSEVDKIMKEIENFLDSKSEKDLILLPDGFILCYEDIKKTDSLCDIYYSPFQKIIKISYTDLYPEDKDFLVNLEDFNPADFKIEENDFKSVIEKCDLMKNNNKDSSFII